MRHAQLALFGEFFDTSGGRGESHGSDHLGKSRVRKQGKVSPLDDFLVAWFFEIFVVPSGWFGGVRGDKEGARSPVSQIQKK